jgi:hypothetical protein
VLGLISTLFDSGDLTRKDIEKLMERLKQREDDDVDPDV